MESENVKLIHYPLSVFYYLLLTVSHLRGERADFVFVKQVSNRAHRDLQKFRGASLVAAGFFEGFDDVGFF